MSNELEFYKKLEKYDNMPNDSRISFRVPQALFDDFKKYTDNQNKELRRLMIQFITDRETSE